MAKTQTKDEQWSVSLPPGLRRRWKLSAAQEGVTMRHQLICWVEKHLAVRKLVRKVRSDSG